MTSKHVKVGLSDNVTDPTVWTGLVNKTMFSFLITAHFVNEIKTLATVLTFENILNNTDIDSILKPAEKTSSHTTEPFRWLPETL